MLTTCQRCFGSRDSWNIHQAELHVGRIKNWKVQLCEACTEAVEQTVLASLKPSPLEER